MKENKVLFVILYKISLPANYLAGKLIFYLIGNFVSVKFHRGIIPSRHQPCESVRRRIPEEYFLRWQLRQR